ncbi:limonene-1,2-epoxide hydrolase family protein [Mycobacterium sp. DBP42]|jgi:limonene-1,2-epoxide hydrolase|uniref:limonene-1,2-epoxide hydrolase family protein n=1 Tax=Mycobacterium sp. DBP42 TaxID=2545267 RepID=UPI00110CCD16|nr:limonene-1,2-epoxide hydrolase family protein [Mycobacterium sp. DBP42]TMS52459.1 hypothetical protein E0T84_16225 [Mycobacterium sp. DBP42]
MSEHVSGDGAEKTVRDFFAMWTPAAGSLEQAIDRFFTDETVWENVGLGAMVGKDQAISFMTGFPIPLAYITAEDITMATAGDIVFAERVDHFHDDTGAIILSARLNGVFVVHDGKIAQWRDYFDTAGFAAELQKLATP